MPHALALGIAEPLGGRFDASFNDKRVLYYEQVDAKDVCRATVAEVEEVPEAVSIGDDVDFVEFVLGVHDLGSLEDDLERVGRDSVGILVNELTARLWFDLHGYLESLVDRCASCGNLCQ